jgi:hypothetical protein
VTADGFTRRPPLRARPPFTRPCPLFLERVCRAYSRPDVAYRLLQLTIRRAGNQTRALRFSQGRRPRPSSFSDVPRLLPCGSGDTRRAALRPEKPTPVLVPPGSPGLPNRDADSSAPPPELSPECIVRIDAHGSPDRVKDASSVCRQRSLAPVIECMRVVAHADDVPLLGYRRTSVVIGAAIPREDTHETRRTDLGLRSDDAPRRAPPSR